jgi:hypothetical protein
MKSLNSRQLVVHLYSCLWCATLAAAKVIHGFATPYNEKLWSANSTCRGCSKREMINKYIHTNIL